MPVEAIRGEAEDEEGERDALSRRTCTYFFHLCGRVSFFLSSILFIACSGRNDIFVKERICADRDYPMIFQGFVKFKSVLES